MMVTDLHEKKPVVHGYFYWKQGLKGPVSERVPIDSGSPPPKPFLMKVPLGEGEMRLSILILEARYPYKGE